MEHANACGGIRRRRWAAVTESRWRRPAPASCAGRGQGAGGGRRLCRLMPDAEHIGGAAVGMGMGNGATGL